MSSQVVSIIGPADVLAKLAADAPSTALELSSPEPYGATSGALDAPFNKQKLEGVLGSLALLTAVFSTAAGAEQLVSQLLEAQQQDPGIVIVIADPYQAKPLVEVTPSSSAERVLAQLRQAPTLPQSGK